MTLHAGRHNAYGAATLAMGPPRSVEYQVFSQVTGELNRAMREDRPFAELAAALTQNQRLWTALAADLVNPDNALPASLKGQILSLAAFTRNHTASVLRREAEPGALVEINTAIMRGLRGQLPAAGGV